MTAFCFFITIFSYAQENAVVTYTYKWGAFEYYTDYQLIINKQLSNFQHDQEPSEITSPQGYLLELSHNYYDWFYDASQKKIIEQRVLKDGTKVIATWEANLSWKIAEETKEIAGYKVQKAITQSHDLAGRDSEYDYGDAIA